MNIQEIVLASGNRGKIMEIQEIFSDLGIRFSGLRDHWNPVPSIPETGNTFEDNARMKAQWVFYRKGLWTLADDSGLEVDALDGGPGVYSARYSGGDATDAGNNELLLSKLEGVSDDKRTARFRCVNVLLGPDTEIVAEGACEGRILHEPRGTEGFGYDPLFVPEGFDKTFAELGSSDKHAISHRGRALAVLKEKMNELR